MAKRKARPDRTGPRDQSDPSDTFARVTIPRDLDDPKRRKQWGLPEGKYEKGRYIIELNLQHIEGLPGAAAALQALCAIVDATSPKKIAKTYYSCRLNLGQVRRLVVEDESRAAEAAAAAVHGASSVPQESGKYRAIFRVWPDFPIKGQIDRSVATVKADAAVRAFAAEGAEVVWAVIDSGVEARHRHFGDYDKAEAGELEFRARHSLLADAVAALHRCFCEMPHEEKGLTISDYLPDPDDVEELGDSSEQLSREERARRRSSERAARLKMHRDAALSDDFGHGTHVAGIIAGGLPKDVQPMVLQREFKVDRDGKKIEKNYTLRRIFEPERLHGIAQRCKIVSLRVLDENGNGHTSDVMRALEYIRERINDDPKLLRVHGVNLSVGYEFDPELFACGQSPVCAEVDRLVQAGVVVVTAAGNTGYGQVQSEQRISKVGLSNTINDPGNAALAITVGSTHRDAPHTYGVSYFSSKGPTGDGRLKPDLVAPGERITSCAAGKKLNDAKVKQPSVVDHEHACYIDDSGTSMAAPHVSGAIASFLSIRREFIGKPLEVKRIFLSSATPLGRERYFEGNGLVDLMRAIPVGFSDPAFTPGKVIGMSIPQFEVEFDRQGRLFDQTQVDAVLAQLPAWSDVVVISHGWNNDKADAKKLYDRFFEKVDLLLDGNVIPGLSGRKFGAIRILWPSKRFTDEELIPGGGAASLDASDANDRALAALLERLKEDPDRLGELNENAVRAAAVSDAQVLVPRLATDAQARREFVFLLRSILNPNEADVDDGSVEFFTRNPEDLFKAMEEPVSAPAPASTTGGAAAAGSSTGGAAGLKDLIGGAHAAARRLVNFTTYYEMKDRAGIVGRTGVRSLLVDVRHVKENVRIHLVGHSFGGRLVTAAARELDPNTPGVSLSLLQAAFSHNGLAKKFDHKNDGHFRRVVSESRVSGPIVITHTKNDKAVGIAYPLASRIAFQKAAFLGGANDPYGGMGRNGALHTPESTTGELQGVKRSYTFKPGTIYNLQADRFIKDHNDVTGAEVAYAVLTAAAAVP